LTKDAQEEITVNVSVVKPRLPTHAGEFGLGSSKSSLEEMQASHRADMVIEDIEEDVTKPNHVRQVKHVHWTPEGDGESGAAPTWHSTWHSRSRSRSRSPLRVEEERGHDRDLDLDRDVPVPSSRKQRVADMKDLKNNQTLHHNKAQTSENAHRIVTLLDPNWRVWREMNLMRTVTLN